MSSRDYFKKGSPKILTAKTQDTAFNQSNSDVESSQYITEREVQKSSFNPVVDFVSSSNFSRYGSAEEYYSNSFKRIYQQFPYDGTLTERVQFDNESTYIDKHIYDNVYPRSNGYAIFSPNGWGDHSSPGYILTGGYGLSDSLECVIIHGGPNTASSGMIGNPLKQAFGETTYRTKPGANYFDTNIYDTDGVLASEQQGTRESNLKFDLSKGVTTEFWLKKGDYIPSHARGSLVVSNATPSNFDAAEFVLISTDGTSKTYLFDDDDDGATGTLSGSKVRVQLQGLSATTTIATQIANAINHVNGHNGKITATAISNVVYVVQATRGLDGNTAITETVSDASHFGVHGFEVVHAATFSQPAATGSSEVIFDLWNGTATSSAGHGRLLISLSGSDNGENPFKVHLASGSSAWDVTFGGSTIATSSLKDTWNHVAFTFLSSSSPAQLESRFYLNGNLQEFKTTTDTPFAEVTGTLIGRIGALQTNPSGNSYGLPHMAADAMVGYGKLSGSIDEFRYWKTKRSSKNIGRHWFTQVGGGSNTDTSNADLGVYYKFNEGIVGDASIDSKVLDYSGRISNGNWVGYTAASRNTGSAMVSASAANSEYKDPILYSGHADVQSEMNRLMASGSVWDEENTSILYNFFPSFIQEEEEESGTKHLKILTQIIGTYFDRLHLQIEGITSLATETYTSASHSPYPHYQKLLNSEGFDTPELFSDATILEYFANRDEDKNFELDIQEIKSRIYQNIYNNISYITKSKGSEKAFRNLIRCFGVDEELIKINLYSDGDTHILRDNYRPKTAKKKFVDFSKISNHTASVYQQSLTGNSNTTHVTYISGTSKHLANTSEIEVIFPKNVSSTEGNKEYSQTPFVTSSIFGYHTASVIPDDFRWPAATSDDHNFELYAVRPEIGSSDAYFLLKDRAGNFSLTSSLYGDVYDNQRWNFSVRLRNEKYPIGDSVTGSISQNAKLEFRGINTLSDAVANDFYLTASLTASYLTAPRRYYVGANLTDFAGATTERSDVRVTSLRHWASYLDDSVLLAHAKDTENYGAGHPLRSAYLTTEMDGIQVPQFETLALNWDFSTVTSSAGDGTFSVPDFSSGSIGSRSRYPGVFGDIVGNQYAGQGINFPQNDSTVTTSEYVYSARQQLPESIGGLDMINVLTADDTVYHRENRPENYYFAFEKSFYQSISEEMLNMFGAITEFNNLIGDPVNKYRQNYKGLDKLRNLFFERVQNTPDIDKYIEYYRWIDTSLSEMLQQLVPLSTNVSEKILTVIESHILERNKYRFKFPIVKEVTATEASIKGLAEHSYPWRRGHAPIPSLALATAGTDIIEIDPSAADDRFTINVPKTIGGTGVNITIRLVSGTPSDGTANEAQVREGSSLEATRNRFVGMINGHSSTISAYGAGSGDVTNGIAGITAAAGSSTTLITITSTTAGTVGTTITLTDTAGTFIEAGANGASPATMVVPLVEREQENCFWWKERAERNRSTITSGDSTVDTRRNEIRKVQVYQVSSSAPYHSQDNRSIYKSSDYIVRSLPRLYDFSARIEKAISTKNVSFVNKKKTYYKSAIAFGSTTGLDITDVQSEKDINDVIDVPKELEKKKKYFTTTDQNDERHAPFSIYSSSAEGGYASILQTSFMDGVDIANNHEDDIGGLDETPMQGPFPERFVGGSPHRHVDLNHYVSTKDGTNNLDSKLDRVEAYDLDLSTGKITIRHQDVHEPRSSFYRDGTAKRPVNFRNIRQVTGSSPAVTKEVSGNFSKKYEVLGLSDRGTNNPSLVKAGGFGSASNASSYISHLNDYAKPTRIKQEHIIVERFSAPGGPETAGDSSGGPFLDLESGQYSPYNDINIRNWTVRKPLRDLLTERSERFGIRSGSSEVLENYIVPASFHKTNRNPLLRKEYNADSTTSIASVYTYDNYYVQHHIPRSDTQYLWLSASHTSSYVVGHAPKDGWWSGSSEGRVHAILFTSASSYYNIVTTPLRLDYGGMNILIAEPISSSVARIGYPLGTDYTAIRNTEWSTIKDIDVLNATNNHRGGIYGFSSWKQIANSYNPLVRKWRKENTLAFNTTPGETILTESPKYEVKQNRFGGLQTFTEPLVTSRNFPLKFIVDVKTKQGKNTAKLESVFGNEVDNFTNHLIDQALNVPDKTGIAYNKVKDMYLNGAIGSKLSPIDGFRSLTYRQNVYPRAQNSFLKKTRSRPGYTNNFWRYDRDDRDSLGNSKFSSYGALSGAYSSWNMDADSTFATVLTGTTAGILQNNRTFFHNLSKQNLTASIIFHNPHDVSATASVQSRTGPSPLSSDSFDTSNTTDMRLGRLFISGGFASWQAGEQAGYYDITGTFVSAPSYPWSDSYDEYVGELRAHNKDYSVIPEFRISEHIENYMNNTDGDFFTDNPSFLSIEGASSSYPQNSSEDNFYKTYSNSDFMKQYCIIREDHRGFVNPTEIKLTCKAIKKFIPYNGFYPSELITGLYTRFSASYLERVKYTGTDASETKQNSRIRPFITPLFAPGIWNNMVKSGIAVDYPIYTSSYVVSQPLYTTNKAHLADYYLISTSSNHRRLGFDKRIPFEATLDPQRYMSNVTMVDMHPHPSASMNVTASWSGDGDSLYKMKAHNAMASMIEFFLPGDNNKGELATLSSSPESQWKPFMKGTTYGMRVKLRKSYNQSRQEQQLITNHYPTPHDTQLDVDAGLSETITICSRPSSFGPPVSGRRGVYNTGDPEGDAVATGGSRYYNILDSLTGVNPGFTPPYYTGEAWADVLYTHGDDGNPTLDEVLSKSKVVNWRFDPKALSASNGGSNGQPYGWNNINNYAMQLTSSINILQQKIMPTVEVDGEGNVISMSNNTSQKTSVWAIQPKMEVPILNVNNAAADIPTYGSESVPRSIWNQFGTIPTGNTGVFLEVSDIDEQWIEQRVPLMFNDGNSPNSNDDSDKIGNSKQFGHYQWQLYGGDDNGVRTIRIESLADKVGFNKRSEKLGQLANFRKVKEAIVAIPFLEENGKRNFFEISKEEIKTSLSLLKKGVASKNSIVDMVSKMTDYVFPPKFDFVKHPEKVSPFAMYIFEFEHEFDKNDLSYIWQNIQPRSGASMQLSEASIEHSLLSEELMGRAMKATGEPLQNELKWMVFKVKQKAATDYYEKLASYEKSVAEPTSGQTVGRATIGETDVPEYSYNWPYDYFSLIEFAKIESSVKFAPTKSGAPSDDDSSFVIRQPDDCPETEFTAAVKNMVTDVIKEDDEEMQTVSEDLLK